MNTREIMVEKAYRTAKRKIRVRVSSPFAFIFAKPNQLSALRKCGYIRARSGPDIERYIRSNGVTYIV